MSGSGEKLDGGSTVARGASAWASNVLGGQCPEEKRGDGLPIRELNPEGGLASAKTEQVCG